MADSPSSRQLNTTFRRLPLGDVEPAGWLRRQLEIQAKGLTGHLDDVWPEFADSRWIGGDSGGWENGPYCADGLLSSVMMSSCLPVSESLTPVTGNATFQQVTG